MLDQRLKLPSAKPLLTSHLQAQLNQILQPPPDLGLGTGPKVAEWISEKIGQKIANQRGWDYLKRLGYSLHQPCPHHVRADEQAQVEFKKTTSTSRGVTKAYPKAQFEVWAYDEHRLGLQPLSRRVWAKRGERPVQQVEIRYQWLYL